jgi:hypothetical protein
MIRKNAGMPVALLAIAGSASAHDDRNDRRDDHNDQYGYQHNNSQSSSHVVGAPG